MFVKDYVPIFIPYTISCYRKYLSYVLTVAKHTNKERY